jgi:hypothetical protein
MISDIKDLFELFHKAIKKPSTGSPIGKGNLCGF